MSGYCEGMVAKKGVLRPEQVDAKRPKRVKRPMKPKGGSIGVLRETSGAGRSGNAGFPQVRRPRPGQRISLSRLTGAARLVSVLRGDRPSMSNDSKLALVLGILFVMFLGIVFFRRDAGSATSPAAQINAVPASSR